MNRQERLFLKKLKEVVKDFDEIVNQPEWQTYTSQMIGNKTIGEVILHLHMKDLKGLISLFDLYRKGSLSLTWRKPKEKK